MNRVTRSKEEISDFSMPYLLEDRPILPLLNEFGDLIKPVTETILDRRANTHFTGEKIPAKYLNAILECGTQAPSGYNLQPWRFIVLEDEVSKIKLKVAAFGQAKVTEAAVVIIAVGMKEDWKNDLDEVFEAGVARGIGKKENLEKAKKGALDFLSKQRMDVWVTKHTMIAFTMMMLAAESYGYDTAPMEGFNPAEVKRMFNIPEEGEVVGVLAIGRATMPRKAYPGRLPLSRIVYLENFGTHLVKEGAK